MLIVMFGLVALSVLLIQKAYSRQSRHSEIREAFILLYMRGYTNEANRLYEKLLRDLPSLSNKQVIDDFQRTLLLVDPSSSQPNNLIWKYHWTISNQLEIRSESTLKQALKIAEEPK